MELAATIAEKDTDIAACFIQVGRMKELVEAFASCSKALAITTAEKKVPGSSSKKLREMGWSRDLWSVKS
jgi:nuclear pore complex protein Nup107